MTDKKRLNVKKYLAQFGISCTVHQVGSNIIYLLTDCLFDPTHDKNQAAIIQTKQGYLTYNCFHRNCAQKTFHDVMKKLGINRPRTKFFEEIPP